MIKLLSANWIRLRRDIVLRIGMVFMFAAGIFFPVMRYRDMRQTGVINHIDNGFFACTLFVSIIAAIFCSLFIGTEYSDGTLRNKIITGHKRTSVYLAHVITAVSVSIVLCAAFFLPYLCIGIPLLGFFEMKLSAVLLFVLTTVLLAAAFSSVFSMISLLNRNKAATAVICILLSFSLLFIGAQLNKMLSEPETNMGLIMTESGQEYEELPNPRYLHEKERAAVQFLYDFLPGGQVMQCISLEAVHLAMLPFYSLVIVLLTTGTGLFFFQRKELN